MPGPVANEEDVVAKVRLGMIGVGGRGSMYKLWKDDPRVEVVAGADVSAAALEAFRKDLPDAAATDDYRRVLDRADVDAVAVCTPDYLHREHAVAALLGRQGPVLREAPGHPHRRLRRHPPARGGRRGGG